MITDCERMKSSIKIHEIIEMIDDGYHNAEISDLIKVSNRLFDELSEFNQVTIKQYFESKERINYEI